MKRFNTTAVCIPSKHYMVDLSERVSEIEKLVVEGKYLTINCARQYGKTTTLRALQETLQSKYTVLSLSFEGVTKAGSQTEGEFVQTFSRLILDKNEFFGIDIPSKTLETLEGYSEHFLFSPRPAEISLRLLDFAEDAEFSPILRRDQGVGRAV